MVQVSKKINVDFFETIENLNKNYPFYTYTEIHKTLWLSSWTFFRILNKKQLWLKSLRLIYNNLDNFNKKFWTNLKIQVDTIDKNINNKNKK